MHVQSISGVEDISVISKHDAGDESMRMLRIRCTDGLFMVRLSGNIQCLDTLPVGDDCVSTDQKSLADAEVVL